MIYTTLFRNADDGERWELRYPLNKDEIAMLTLFLSPPSLPSF